MEVIVSGWDSQMEDWIGYLDGLINTLLYGVGGSQIIPKSLWMSFVYLIVWHMGGDLSNVIDKDSWLASFPEVFSIIRDRAVSFKITISFNENVLKV